MELIDPFQGTVTDTFTACSEALEDEEMGVACYYFLAGKDHLRKIGEAVAHSGGTTLLHIIKLQTTLERQTVLDRMISAEFEKNHMSWYKLAGPGVLDKYKEGEHKKYQVLNESYAESKYSMQL